MNERRKWMNSWRIQGHIPTTCYQIWNFRFVWTFGQRSWKSWVVHKSKPHSFCPCATSPAYRCHSSIHLSTKFIEYLIYCKVTEEKALGKYKKDTNLNKHTVSRETQLRCCPVGQAPQEKSRWSAVRLAEGSFRAGQGWRWWELMRKKWSGGQKFSFSNFNQTN